MKKYIFEMKEISKTFPGVVALDKLSLKIKSDSFQVKASNTARLVYLNYVRHLPAKPFIKSIGDFNRKFFI
mgnify:CR=1 FL=1